MLVAHTGRGLALLGMDEASAPLEAALRTAYPQTELLRDDEALRAVVHSLARYLDGAGPLDKLPLDVRATPFQARVWAALQAIPYGETRSYGQLAAQLGLSHGAARAVGSACAANPVALVVPCHRAVGADGRLHGFRWGLDRKARLLALEQGR